MNTLQHFIRAWLHSGQEEHTPDSAMGFSSNAHMLWQQLDERNWLRKGASGKWGLSPQAIHFADKPATRISPAQAQDALAHIRARVHTWNAWALENGLPTLAAVAVWGSAARPSATSHGDVDLAVVWRRPLSYSTPSLSIHPAPLPLENNLPTWEVEERVEAWLEEISPVTISGVDQWEEFGQQDDFATRLLHLDEGLSGSGFCLEGVKPYEWETFAAHVVLPTVGQTRKFVLK